MTADPFSTFAGAPADPAAQRALYLAIHRIVHPIVAARGGSRADADDVLSQVALAVMNKLRKKELPDHPRAYVARATVNALRRMRRRSNEPIAAEPAGTLSTETRVLASVLRRLSPRLREAFVLYYVDGTSIEAIAARTRSTPAAVRKRVARARQAVYAELDSL